ncbi:claudin domain-containing protein 1 isoform X3 [Fundulus heteroclitus]|uniref:claudin domain-containing protein 1 isoform X3 n=1 Tax=Fundulus heteroclitus TaxID=8078 RepID=UPI00165B334A|nr:claudin domain-containing protein 1 isoform X3 [Fundulus heteroclitus]
MVDNRYATALVIGSVLSLLATVYLSVAVGTQQWFQYSSKHGDKTGNGTSPRERFMADDWEEKNFSDLLLQRNGTLGLWWRCIQLPSESLWYREPDPKMETFCVPFTLPQQFRAIPKTPGNGEPEEDLLRTYLWRCQFLLPLVSLALVFLSALVGFCACLCRSFTPTLGVGVLHFLAGLCSLGAVCCFRTSVHLLGPGADGSVGWSFYLALISFPLQIMAGALFLWAARSHRKSYTRIAAYRIA